MLSLHTHEEENPISEMGIWSFQVSAVSHLFFWNGKLQYSLLLGAQVANGHYYQQVWTLCLMHRCVCIWWYILQNYNYKLHFQNLFIYNIPHVSMGTLATENLNVCTACDPWDSNIQLTMGIDRRWQIYPNVVQLASN
jgi:hypothetical protein